MKPHQAWPKTAGKSGQPTQTKGAGQEAPPETAQVMAGNRRKKRAAHADERPGQESGKRKSPENAAGSHGMRRQTVKERKRIRTKDGGKESARLKPYTA